jgi:hypothetical protein
MNEQPMGSGYDNAWCGAAHAQQPDRGFNGCSGGNHVIDDHDRAATHVAGDVQCAHG